MKNEGQGQTINLTPYLKNAFNYKKGEYLFHEGDSDNHVFYIKDGGVNIFKKNSILWNAYGDEFIGISSFFSDGIKYRFSAKASQDCVAYKIGVTDFKEMLGTYPEFSKKIAEALCNRIQMTNSRTKTFLQSSSRSRLIREVLQKAAISDSREINYTLDEMSEIVGVSKRLIRNILSDLEKKKLLERAKGKLTILDIGGLEVLADKN